MAFKKKEKTKSIIQLHVVSANSPFAFTEAYKSLRTNLNFVSVSNEYKKIVVTSSIPEEGKSNVVINLAISLAQGGNKVLVVDCDLRKPMMHKYLKINKRGKGITTILSGEVTLKEATTRFADIGISVLCTGAIPPNPTEILGSNRMGELVEQLEKEYDYIIFDTPPVSIVTDAAVLSKYADGVLLVIRQKHATVESAQLAMKNLSAVHANVIGAVLNDFDTTTVGKDNGYYYSYEYNYSKGN